VLVGVGLGLLLTGLTRLAVPHGSRAARDASYTIAARHAGVVAGLLLLTPIFTADLDAQEPPTQRAAISELLDAPLPLDVKIRLTRGLAEAVEDTDGRMPDLEPAFAAAEADPSREPALRDLRTRMEEELDRAGTAAFSTSFLVAAGLALLALAPIAVLAGRRT
jgi:hypothetical protein